jgi:uncharacterized linocin/CFP29 family protein
MDHLRRELAPISDRAWSEIDAEATRSLVHFLAARKLVDVTGPLGWEHAAVATGRTEELPTDADGVIARRRASLEMIELRTPFELSLDELDAVDRGAGDIDLDAVVDAARRAASAEDHLAFDGVAGTSVRGVAASSPHAPIALSTDYSQYATSVATAVAGLKAAGVGGPYALALGPTCYRGVIETTEHGGYPLLEHLRLILGGPVVWAPSVNGAVLVSQRGGDAEVIIGQDFAIGYAGQDGTSVQLYLEESVTVRIASPEAAVALTYQ